MSLGGLVVFGIPETGTMVQERHQISVSLLELVAQGLGKEGMIAIPLPLVIQGDHK